MRFEGVETGSRQDASSLDPIPSLPSVQVCVHLLSKTDCFDLIFSEEAPSLSYAEKLFKAYDEVETFVMFIGYPRSSHSLVGAILDAHPEIIIPCLGKYFNEACVVPDKKLSFPKDFLCFYMAWLHVITKSITYTESETLSKPHFKFEFEHPHFI